MRARGWEPPVTCWEPLGAASDLLGTVMDTLVDKEQYKTALGRHLGPIIVTVKEKDLLCAMVEINRGQHDAILGKDKKEYDELSDVFTMLTEMIAFHRTCKAKGKGKRGMCDTAATSESCPKCARCVRLGAGDGVQEMRQLGLASIMRSVDVYRCALYLIPVPRCHVPTHVGSCPDARRLGTQAAALMTAGWRVRRSSDCWRRCRWTAAWSHNSNKLRSSP